MKGKTPPVKGVKRVSDHTTAVLLPQQLGAKPFQEGPPKINECVYTKTFTKKAKNQLVWQSQENQLEALLMFFLSLSCQFFNTSRVPPVLSKTE